MQFSGRDVQTVMVAATGCGSVAEIGLLALVVFFYLSLMRALTACAPAHRRMEPALVWLNFVPGLSVVWCFLTVAAVGNSLRAEYEARGRHRGGGYGKAVGFALCVVGLLEMPAVVIGGVLTFVGYVEENERLTITAAFGTLGAVALLGVIWLVLFFVYWAKVAGYTRGLTRPTEEKRPDDTKREFDDDYRPRA